MVVAGGVTGSARRPRHIASRWSLRRAGARFCARVCVAVALAVAVAAPLAAGPSQADSGSDVTVTVHLDHEVYEVQGQFEAGVPRDVAWATLTDYEHIATFVNSLRKSVVESRDTNQLLVRQEGVMGVFPFRSVAHVLLDVREKAPRRIEFRDVLARDFRSYSGVWELQGDSTQVHVTYALHARPFVAAPHVLGRGISSRTVKDMLTQLRREMTRRAADDAAHMTR
jgi:hypothetical protein